MASCLAFVGFSTHTMFYLFVAGMIRVSPTVSPTVVERCHSTQMTPGWPSGHLLGIRIMNEQGDE